MMQRRVIVIGGGPAGLIAAEHAARLGAQVILLEKMDQPGRKLLITGGGRCNFTNSAPLRDHIARFGPNGRFLHQAYSRFFSGELIRLFQALGLKTSIEKDGCVFPSRGRGSDVLRALVEWARESGVTILTEAPVKAFIIAEGRITGVKASDPSSSDQEDLPIERSYGRDGRALSIRRPAKHQVYPADSVILATGGASYPATGSTGDGYRLAKSAGHTIVPIRPALVPLHTAGALASKLQGVSLDGAGVRLWIDGKKRKESTGSVLFTHFGLSGPAILSLSKLVVEALDMDQKVEVTLDQRPSLSEEELDALLIGELDGHGRKKLSSLLKRLLPNKMAQVCAEEIGGAEDKLCHQVTSIERGRLRRWLKELRLEITGYRAIEEAMVTAGGVALSEVDPRSMESRLVKGLYFAGEVLDLDGDTGGFNLQAAFSTGWLAGEAAVGKRMKDEG